MILHATNYHLTLSKMLFYNLVKMCKELVQSVHTWPQRLLFPPLRDSIGASYIKFLKLSAQDSLRTKKCLNFSSSKN